MWILGPRSKASEVFGSFQDNAGWGNIGFSCLVGQLSAVFSLIGSDAATHLSEEVHDASRIVPQAMIWTAVFNSLLGLVMLITFGFCLGDIETIITTATGQPHIQALYNATQSKTGTTILASIIIAMAIFGCVNNVATCSRQLFAFARDCGIPYSSFLSRVQPGKDIPLNSVLISFGCSVALSMINVGSTVAFNSIASLGTCALLSSYIISISCMFFKRWRKEPLVIAPFSLGKAGLWVNGFSVVYLSMAFIFAFMPPFPTPTVDLMNWSVLIYSSVVGFSLAYFYFRGSKAYKAPVECVAR